MLTRAKPDNADKPRRFWKEVDIGETEHGFVVRLDGRPAKTPAGAPLALPTRALAEVVAEEWAAQGETVEFASMLATRLASTALDRVPQQHAAVAREVAKYAGSDLLCYVAEGPEPLVRAEQAAWTPLLAWADETLGLKFVQAEGIVHTPQPAETVEQVEQLAAAADDLRLTALAFAAPLFGSAVLALALERGRITGEQAWEASRVDEAFQESRWGVDAEAAERAARLKDEALLLERWFRGLDA
jgi:chaperone required for assembly of F1-ATPase